MECEVSNVVVVMLERVVVSVPYQTSELAASFVVQIIFAEVLLTTDVCVLEIVGPVVSATVTKLDWLDVAVLPVESTSTPIANEPWDARAGGPPAAIHKAAATTAAVASPSAIRRPR